MKLDSYTTLALDASPSKIALLGRNVVVRVRPEIGSLARQSAKDAATFVSHVIFGSWGIRVLLTRQHSSRH